MATRTLISSLHPGMTLHLGQVEMILKLRAALGAVEAALDPQLHEEIAKFEFDAPPDAEFNVNVTAKLWGQINRALTGYDTAFPEIVLRRHWVVNCAYCDAHRDDKMMPYHDASDRCESGKHDHCTCDACY